ncbi:MAG: hypothetical protein SGPRY_003173 [Prymnesium sp.]
MPPAPLNPTLDKLRVILALGTVDELKQFLASWPEAKPRKKMNAASWANKIASVYEEEKERLDAIVAQRQNQQGGLRLLRQHILHLQYRVPPLLGVREDRGPQYPRADVNTDGVDKLLSDANMCNLTAKKKFLAARCDYGEDRAEDDAGLHPPRPPFPLL